MKNEKKPKAGSITKRKVGRPKKDSTDKLIETLFKAPECPCCGSSDMLYPALSRRDNKTDICSPCGQEEGMIDFSRRSFPTPIQNELNFLTKLARK